MEVLAVHIGKSLVACEIGSADSIGDVFLNLARNLPGFVKLKIVQGSNKCLGVCVLCFVVGIEKFKGFL